MTKYTSGCEYRVGLYLSDDNGFVLDADRDQRLENIYHVVTEPDGDYEVIVEYDEVVEITHGSLVEDVGRHFESVYIVANGEHVTLPIQVQQYLWDLFEERLS